jgi:cytochrome c-type biogenesis protein CcmH/NrfG|eukprot:scaffold706_cov190-Alexandrium_tamarense.AAC.15
METFQDLIPPTYKGLIIENAGCLSQCGNGPNVSAEKNGSERLYLGINDVTSASAVLDVATGEDFPISLLMAASAISEAQQSNSFLKKETLLTSAIETLAKDSLLVESFAYMHALFLRAGVRLELMPSNVEGALEDARLATKLDPSEAKAWRVLARAEEEGGNVKEAIDALRRLAKADALYATKAKKEIERLSSSNH